MKNRWLQTKLTIEDKHSKAIVFQKVLQPTIKAHRMKIISKVQVDIPCLIGISIVPITYQSRITYLPKLLCLKSMETSCIQRSNTLKRSKSVGRNRKNWGKYCHFRKIKSPIRFKLHNIHKRVHKLVNQSKLNKSKIKFKKLWILKIIFPILMKHQISICLKSETLSIAMLYKVEAIHGNRNKGTCITL